MGDATRETVNSSSVAVLTANRMVRQGMDRSPQPSLSVPSPETYMHLSHSSSLSPSLETESSPPHISLSYPVSSASVISDSIGVIVFARATPAINSSHDMNEGKCSGWRYANEGVLTYSVEPEEDAVLEEKEFNETKRVAGSAESSM